MSTIFKYVVPLNPDHGITMPKDAELLHVAGQDNNICVWARVQPGNRPEKRSIYLAVTGGPVPAKDRYVGSGLLHDGRFVGHVFEALGWD